MALRSAFAALRQTYANSRLVRRFRLLHPKVVADALQANETCQPTAALAILVDRSAAVADLRQFHLGIRTQP